MCEFLYSFQKVHGEYSKVRLIICDYEKPDTDITSYYLSHYCFCVREVLRRWFNEIEIKHFDHVLSFIKK